MQWVTDSMVHRQPFNLLELFICKQIPSLYRSQRFIFVFIKFFFSPKLYFNARPPDLLHGIRVCSFTTKILHEFLISPIHAACPSHYVLSGLTILTLDEECNHSLFITFCILHSNILMRTLCSKHLHSIFFS